MPRIIGLMSGTSADGIDAALVDLSGGQTDLQVNLIAAQTTPYPPDLRQQILDACSGKPQSMEQLAALDDAIATCFAQSALALIQTHGSVTLIGSHGQTVFHRPATSQQLGYSLQLGRGTLIAQLTGIPTISNFRSADIAAGGQGAPLVPAIDQYLLGHPTEHRCIQNLGGIGNVTYLPPQTQPNWQTHIQGWDTGPANSLLDLAAQKLSHGQLTYDANGTWAAQGTPCQPLLQHWLQHPYFTQAPPKSTGRELFGWAYLDQCLQEAAPYQLSDADLLATLTDLTAASIALNYDRFLPQRPDRVLLCGGGSRNQYLCDRLHHHLAPALITTTTAHGLNADFKEAIAFAVLAHWHEQNLPGNLPSVTGSHSAVILGERANIVRARVSGPLWEPSSPRYQPT